MASIDLPSCATRTTPGKRLVRLFVTIDQGLTTVAAEGLPDDVEFEVVQVDYDSEGASPEELYFYGGRRAFVSVGGLGAMDPEEATEARGWRDAWALECRPDEED